MSFGNKQGWRLGVGITKRQHNENLYVVLVNLKKEDVDYYVYEYDVLSERVEAMYNEYIALPKKDGSQRKDVNFRWFDFKNFTEDDFSRKSKWCILGF